MVKQNYAAMAIQREQANAAAASASDASALIQKGWSSVGELGIVYPLKDHPNKPTNLLNAPNGKLSARTCPMLEDMEDSGEENEETRNGSQALPNSTK